MGRNKKNKQTKNDCNLLSGTVTVLCCVVLYYLGLENIHALTNTSTKYEVRFDLGLGSERAYAVYDDFKVGSAKQKFKLTIGNYRGNAGKMEAENIYTPSFSYIWCKLYTMLLANNLFLP